MTHDTPVLDVRNLTVEIEGRTIVRQVSFHISAGETLALLGESGSGKSLTASAVMGLLPAGSRIDSESCITLSGRVIDPMNENVMRPIRGREMAMIFQDPMSRLNPFMTIGGQLAESIRRAGQSDIFSVTDRARELLRLVELLDPDAMLRRHAHELSGGQQQRVMIAMALACRPRLLIADEATSALDATVGAEILRLLARLRRELGTAILFITHNLHAAAALADRVMVMQAGRLIEQGSIGAVLRAPRHDYTRTLVSSRAMLDLPTPRAAGQAAAQTVLDISDLCFSYPRKGLFARPHPVLKGVSLNVAMGETLGILGESGSGKSTIAQLVLGLLAPSDGRIALFGQPIERMARLDRSLRRRTQMIFQNPQGALNPRLSVRQSLMEPLHLLGLTAEATPERLARALADVQLSAEFLDRYPHQLSGGQRQRIAIARALLSRPDLLICDEVVSALDAVVQMQVLAMLKKLQAQRGFAMMFIGHDVEIVRWVSDRIVVVNSGTIVEQGKADEIVRHPREDYTRRLMAASRPLPRPDADLTQAATGRLREMMPA